MAKKHMPQSRHPLHVIQFLLRKVPPTRNIYQRLIDEYYELTHDVDRTYTIFCLIEFLEDCLAELGIYYDDIPHIDDNVIDFHAAKRRILEHREVCNEQ